MNTHRAVHEKMAALIAKKTHAKVFFPIYPKLPGSTVLPCVAVLNNFLSFILKQGKVILVGDSSGAALALAIATEREEVTTIVAISPWLDLRLDEKVASCAEDKVLCPERLRYLARLWAYDLPYENVKLSPIYGDYSGKRIFLFAGEKEIFAPYARAFFKMNADKGVDIHYSEGESMQHDYPLLPIPEGRSARKRICEIISEELYKREEV